MNTTELKAIIEAMIYVAEEPITEGALADALADAGVGRDELRSCLEAIEREWNGDAARGIGLVQVAGGFQFRTKAAHADWIRRLNVPRPMRLSGPALETLAIVAYRQPIVRSEIERIRGVDSGAVLKTLLERRLLRIVGRRDEPGQPLLYGTTREFLEIFNLNALTELPTLKDIEDIMRERRTITEAQAPPAMAGSHGEGPAEVVGVEEEKTEVIRGERPLGDEGEGGGEDGKDQEALSDLDQRLKDLRRLERHIFPRPSGADETPGGGKAHGGETPQAGAPGGAAPASVAPAGSDGDDGAPADADGADAPGPDDRPFE